MPSPTTGLCRLAYACAVVIAISCHALTATEAVDVATLHDRGLAQLRAGEHAAAIATFDALLQADPSHATAHYNLACAHALSGNPDQALASLEQAVAHGFRDSAHLRQDPDLQALHDHEGFTALCQDLAERTRPRYEPGAEIDGIRSVEGDPADGLRYRLRIGSGASAEEPHRLVVWLHPSGASANRRVETLAPFFAERGYALLVFTQKQWRGWTASEGAAALATLPHVAEREPAVTVVQPILMGFSAGGQQALSLWQADPAAFGGLLLNAAYPIVIDGASYKMIEPPTDATTSILVISGGDDNGTGVWRAQMPLWNEQGLQIQLHEVPDKGHTFLFAGAAMDVVGTWLEEIGAASQVDTAPAPD